MAAAKDATDSGRSRQANSLNEAQPVDVGIVVDHQCPVAGAANVQLNAVGPDAARGQEGLDGVLRYVTVQSAMGKDLSHGVILTVPRMRSSGIDPDRCGKIVKLPLVKAVGVI
jgi:hypothetical protein